jgi:small subunit ribosomal protein S2
MDCFWLSAVQNILWLSSIHDIKLARETNFAKFAHLPTDLCLGAGLKKLVRDKGKWRFNPLGVKTMTAVTMKDMLQAGVHFGHRTRYWQPANARYIFGERNGVHIINLETTLPLFQDAINYVGAIAAKKGRVLFVGTKHAASEIVKEEAQRCGMPYVDHRWLGGMLTNYKTIRRSIRRLKILQEQFEKGEFGRLTKKEILTLEREKKKLARSLGGIQDMGGLPEALFVIDVGQERTAVAEANKLHIPVIAVVDTNYMTTGIDYVIPGNDDSSRSIRLYLRAAADAVLLAKAQHAQTAKPKTVKTAAVKTAPAEKAKPAVKAKPAAKTDVNSTPDAEKASEGGK